jgi:geranylgeranyl diphosphate synthase type II
MLTNNTNNYLKEQKQKVDKALLNYLPSKKDIPGKLYDAMAYGLLSGGKRIRPILVLTVGKIFRVSEKTLMPTACAIEFIHTYSLIHDDLPAMDDDDLRRGKPTTHKAFGEAVAILAGDALLTQAMEVLVSQNYHPVISKKLISEITSAIGAKGMVGGQVLDLHFTQDISKTAPNPDNKAYARMLEMKTAALIKASVCCGGIIAKCSKKMLGRLEAYGQHIGLAFQLKDDALDYPILVRTKYLNKAKNTISRAKLALKPLGKKSELLEALADYIVNRTY